jgi:hypothetical protein
MKLIKMSLLSGLVMLLSTLAPYDADAQATLVRILTAPGVWGENFPAALAHLQAWARVNERTVLVFPDQVVGGTPFITQEEAQRLADELRRALNLPRPQSRPEFSEVFKQYSANQSIPFNVEAVYFGDDDSYRVAWMTSPEGFMNPSLTFDTIEKLIGQPEEIRTEVVETQGERRPVVLTLHTYAGGAVIFAESDLSPRPGFVDRAILDVRALMSAVFQEAQQ